MMYNTRLIIFVALVFPVLVFGQEIRVLDKETQVPIEGVIMSSSVVDLTQPSDFDGRIDMDLFPEYGVYRFKHEDYFVSVFTLKKIQKQNYTILLSKRPEALQEVVLSVSKTAEDRKLVAEQIAIIDAKEIEQIAPQTTADLLAQTPGVRVQKSQFGGGSPVIRGMEANRVLLVIDGVRMNNAIYRKGHLQNSITVSPLSLERTEVLFGPSSVRYGSDALGGVIHFYTQKPLPSEIEETNLNIYSRYASINNEFTNQAAFEIKRKTWASYTSISHSQFGDLTMGSNRTHGYERWGLVPYYSDNTRDYYNPNPVANSNPELQKNTGFDQTDLIQKFVFDLNKQQQLTLNFQYSTSSDIPRFDKLTELSLSGLKFAEWYYGPQLRLLGAGTLESQMNGRIADRNTTVVAYQHIEEERVQRKFGSLDRSYRNESVDVFSVNSDFDKRLSNRSVLQYGVEFGFNGVDSDAIGRVLDVQGSDIIGFTDTFDVQTRYPDGGSTYNNQAAYADLKYSISERSTFDFGLRFTATQLEAQWVDQTYITLPEENINLKNAALTANASFVYNPASDWQLSVLLSSGFRSPNIDDVGKIREKNGFVSVPNIDLQPEYAYNGELGLAKYFNKDKFRLSLNTYFTLLDDYIMRGIFDLSGAPVDLDNPPTIIYDGEEAITYANINMGTAYIYGFTFGAQGKFSPYWTAKADFTYTKGRSYDQDNPLSSIPPLFGLVNVDYNKNKIGFGVGFDFNSAKNPEDYNLIEGIDNISESPLEPSIDGLFAGTPSWYILNFNSSYEINQHAALQFMVQNLFDQHYKEFASSISAPGRNYVFSLMLTI